MGTRVVLVVLIGVALLWCVGVALYFTKYFNVICIDTAVWGQFGDYFGGVTNPILGFLTFLGVLWTIHISQEQTAHMKNETISNDINNKKDDIYKIIETIFNDISIKLNTVEIEAVSEGYLKPVLVKKFLISPDSANKYLKLTSQNNDLTISEFAMSISSLMKYCSMYEKIGGSFEITYFFKVHYFYLIQFLYDTKKIDAEVYKYFNVGNK